VRAAILDLEDIYRSVLDGRFPIALLDSAAMLHALKQLRRRAQDADYDIVIDTQAQFMLCPTSFIMGPDGLIVYAHVPLASRTTLLQVVQHIPTPMTADGDDFVVVSPPNDIVLTSARHNLFTTMTRDQLDRCHFIADTYFCPLRNLLYSSTADIDLRTDHCAYYLATHDFRSARAACIPFIQPVTTFGQQISRNQFVLLDAPTPHTTSQANQHKVSCAGKEPAFIRPHRSQIITLGPACSAFTTHLHMFTPPVINNVNDSFTLEWPTTADFDIHGFVRGIPQAALIDPALEERWAAVNRVKQLMQTPWNASALAAHTHALHEVTIERAATQAQFMAWLMPSLIAIAVTICLAAIIAAIAYWCCRRCKPTNAQQASAPLVLLPPAQDAHAPPYDYGLYKTPT
jgi:hypothetical protein